jgi:D-alanyl-D-alanine carboxypeptidase
MDGSGGGNTSATPIAVTDFLHDRITRPTFQTFLDSLPILAVDGSLVFVTNFESDPTLADAKGNVHAKTGTFVEAGSTGLVLKSQALAGYVVSKGGKQLIFEIVVNNVKIKDLNDVLQAFQDEGKIAAILWRDN